MKNEGAFQGVNVVLSCAQPQTIRQAGGWGRGEGESGDSQDLRIGYRLIMLLFVLHSSYRLMCADTIRLWLLVSKIRRERQRAMEKERENLSQGVR